MKLYKSKEWMKWAYIYKGMTETEIAEACKVNQSTIHRWLKKHEII